METVTITIVIPTYNRQEMLRKTMDGMVHQETDNDFNYEVLIIDDGSTDNTAAVVREIQEKSAVPVHYIAESGRGYTAVLNRAVQEFKGQYLAFFDDDQHTHSTWLRELYEVARDQGAEMVGGPILLDLPDAVLAGIGPVCRDLYGESPDVRDPETYMKKDPLPSGGNRLVHRSVFEKVGTFDESMLTGGCDRDFLLRSLAAGVTMGWAKGAAGYHQIPPERITSKHIKWYSLQFGCSFAYIDWKRMGGVKTTLSCIARLGQALLINFPLLLRANIQKDKSEILDRTALLWRAVGYLRKTLQMIAPKLFAQENFFSQVEFRRAQKSAQKGEE